MASIVAPECSTDRLHPLRKRRTRTRAFYSLREEAFNVELGSVRSLPSTVAMTTKTSAKVIDGKPMAKQIRQEVAGEIARMKDTIGVVSGLVVILVGSRKDSQTYVRNRKKSCEDVGITSFEVYLPEDSTKEEVLKHISGFNNDLSRGNATISIVHSYTKKPEEITRQADIVISAAGVANLVTGSWIKPGAVIINVGINPVDDPECPRGYRPVMSVTKRPAW